MSAPAHRHEPAAPPAGGPDTDHEGHGAHSGWLMLACCIPMVLAIVLIVVGR